MPIADIGGSALAKHVLAMTVALYSDRCRAIPTLSDIVNPLWGEEYNE